MKAQRLMSRFLPACAALLLAAAGAQAQTNGTAPTTPPPTPPNGTGQAPPLNPSPGDPVPSNGVVKPPPTGDQEIQKPMPSPGPNSMPVVPPPANTVPK